MDRNNAFVSTIILILILVGCYQWWEKERIEMVEWKNQEKTNDSLACLKRLVDGGPGKRKCPVFSAESTTFEFCFPAKVNYMFAKRETECEASKEISQAGYWASFSPNGWKQFVPISHYGTLWCNFMKRHFGLHHVELTEYNHAIPMDQNQRVFYGRRCHVVGEKPFQGPWWIRFFRFMRILAGIKDEDEVWEHVEGAPEEVKTMKKVLRCNMGDAFYNTYVDVPIVRVKGVKDEPYIGTASLC